MVQKNNVDIDKEQKLFKKFVSVDKTRYREMDDKIEESIVKDISVNGEKK